MTTQPDKKRKREEDRQEEKEETEEEDEDEEDEEKIFARTKTGKKHYYEVIEEMRKGEIYSSLGCHNGGVDAAMRKEEECVQKHKRCSKENERVPYTVVLYTG